MEVALREHVRAWCHQPVDFWSPGTTRWLASCEWERLRREHSWGPDDYNTAQCVSGEQAAGKSAVEIRRLADGSAIRLELPCPRRLRAFYVENGLSPVAEELLASTGAAEKLGDGVDLLATIPGLGDTLGVLVRAINVVESPTDDVDASYSHPGVPFSIFLSVCRERSSLASARVAESILHEAMHLRLSLIETTVDLLASGVAGATPHFSPWRTTERPAGGVLHGLFVFRGVLECFRWLSSHSDDGLLVAHAVRRIGEISLELEQIRDFHESPALTPTGASLARYLLYL